MRHNCFATIYNLKLSLTILTRTKVNKVLPKPAKLVAPLQPKFILWPFSCGFYLYLVVMVGHVNHVRHDAVLVLGGDREHGPDDQHNHQTEDGGHAHQMFFH